MSKIYCLDYAVQTPGRCTVKWSLSH